MVLATYKVFMLSIMKARAVSQTAGAAPHGDVHLRRLVLTTSINHQSNFIFLCHHLLISFQELMHDIYANRMDFSCED